MNKLAIILVAMGLAMTGCGKKAETPQKPPATNAPSTSETSSSSGSSLDYLGAINRAQKVAVKTIDLASIKKAIELFNAQEERFPKDLNELVTTHYLQELPKLPRGMVYNYDPKTGNIQVLKTQ